MNFIFYDTIIYLCCDSWKLSKFLKVSSCYIVDYSCFKLLLNYMLYYIASLLVFITIKDLTFEKIGDLPACDGDSVYRASHSAWYC